jgi:hypothetical protein
MRRFETLAVITLVTLSGCSRQNPLLTYGPHPRVQDCMLLQQATPTKYVCDCKTYTAVQLTDIRNGAVASK